MGYALRKDAITPDGRAWCSHFKRWLPVEDFGPNRSRRNGLQIFSNPARYIRRRRRDYNGDCSLYKSQHRREQQSAARRAMHLADDHDKAIYVIGGTRTTVECKVGFSKNPTWRARAIRTTLGHDCDVLRAYRVPGAETRRQIMSVERKLHDALVRRGFYRKHGSEVFSRSAFEASRLIEFVDGYARRNKWERIG